MNDVQFDSYRGELYNRVEAIVGEGQLHELLYEVTGAAEADLREQFGAPDGLGDLTEETAQRLLASVEAWASVASHVTYQAYFGPLREVGAMSQKLVGFSRTVEAKLTELANLLKGYLRAAMRSLRAASFTIQAGFPWGVSVGLT